MDLLVTPIVVLLVITLGILKCSKNRSRHADSFASTSNNTSEVVRDSRASQVQNGEKKRSRDSSCSDRNTEEVFKGKTVQPNRGPQIGHDLFDNKLTEREGDDIPRSAFLQNMFILAKKDRGNQERKPKKRSDHSKSEQQKRESQKEVPTKVSEAKCSTKTESSLKSKEARPKSLEPKSKITVESLSKSTMSKTDTELTSSMYSTQDSQYKR
ncbi:hypothetical protein L596_022898 [Steinernema carpocapsae]|uniref:Uncharacterized protein n=1 Tax=Steinernema carpocapsae TaxID=34508 RepID=A0A4U5MC66_STECR|nr:hypothetical protein L596_022898 [Steinernema carpocapsae]